MLKTGLILMVMGMGMVFIFLTILYFVVLLMGKVMVFLDKIMPPEVPSAAPVAVSANNDAEIAAAIAVAKSRLG